jgi:hypothetical protein
MGGPPRPQLRKIRGSYVALSHLAYIAGIELARYSFFYRYGDEIDGTDSADRGATVAYRYFHHPDQSLQVDEYRPELLMKIWDSQPRSRVKPVQSGSVPAVPTQTGDQQSSR